MSPWTALLESLHSALIDELTERHPDPKPELGMPIRQSHLQIPFTDPHQALFVGVAVHWNSKSSPGLIIIAMDAAASSKLSLTCEDLWTLMQHRTGAEFQRRGIQPIFSSPQNTPPSSPQRVIWIPFSLNPGKCFLAIATL